MGSKETVILVLLASWFVLPAAVAEPDLAALRAQYEKQRDRIVTEYAGKAVKVADVHLKSLQALKKQLEAAGDAEGTAAVAAEIERFQRERRLLEDASEATLLIMQNMAGSRPAQHEQFRTPVPPVTGRPARPPAPKTVPAVPDATRIAHAASGTRVTVSSTHTGEPGELPAEALVDGDLFTRWSSEYSPPQRITLSLDTPMRMNRLRLHWERASATRYCVYASMDGKNWTSIYLFMRDMREAGDPVDRIDEIELHNILAQYLKIELQDCVSKEWGFSLYEIELIRSADMLPQKK